MQKMGNFGAYQAQSAETCSACAPNMIKFFSGGPSLTDLKTSAGFTASGLDLSTPRLRRPASQKAAVPLLVCVDFLFFSGAVAVIICHEPTSYGRRDGRDLRAKKKNARAPHASKRRRLPLTVFSDERGRDRPIETGAVPLVSCVFSREEGCQSGQIRADGIPHHTLSC